jgi:Right handed beta helix region
MRIDPKVGRWPARLLVALVCAAAVGCGLPGAASAAPTTAPAAGDATPGESAGDTAADPAGDTTADDTAPADPAPAERTAAEAAARRAAAERAAAAQAAAARAAARAADAAQRDRAVWETHGRPAALIVVRQTSVDLVDQGRTTRRIPRSGSTLTLTTLGRFLPAGWLTADGGTARLSTAVVLTPGVTLDVGAPVTTLQLAGGATPADAASLWTGGGALSLRGVTVTSADRTSGRPMPSGPGRPFILVSPGGRFTATDATVSDLGSTPTDAADTVPDHPGVDFHAGSTGSLVRTSLLRNGTGLALDGSQGVHLEDVTVSGSTGAGLVLHGDRGTTMAGVRAEHNGTDGVQVTGPSTDRPVTGLSTTGNGGYGVVVDKQNGLQISGVTTAADATGGVEVEQSGSVTLTGVTTTDEPTGVFTHVNSSKIVIDQLTSTGGRRAVMVEKTSDTVTIRDASITGATVTGISAGGTDTTLTDVTVSGARSWVRVERGAHGVTAERLTLTGGLDGVVASPGTDGLVLQDLRADDVRGDAVRSSSPDARIVGGRITGGATGIAVDAPTTISGTTIGLVDQGIRTQSPNLVHADDIDVDAVSVGINAAAGSPFLLTGSRVHALEAVRGTLTAEGRNDLSLPPLNLLGAIGIPLVLLAVGLQVVAALRGRRYGGNTWRPAPVLPPAAPVAAEVAATAAPAAVAATPAAATPAAAAPVRTKRRPSLRRKTPAHAA